VSVEASGQLACIHKLQNLGVTIFLIFGLSMFSLLQLQRTVKAVQEHHERRMEKLREMIEERRQSVADHEAGHRKLADDEYDRVTRQINNFQRKLKTMEETNSLVSGRVASAVVCG
jgi:biopolymer transport protein ExbB/TolQ